MNKHFWRYTCDIFCALLLTASTLAFAQSYPDCSNATSWDSGGWGWENNQSCFRYPTCSNASADPDGDNWGWENNTTCVVYHTCSSAAADPDNDGWGWEHNESCSVNGAFGGYAGELANGNANQATQTVYAYLQGLPNGSQNRLLSGAFGGYSGITGNDAFSLNESDNIAAWTGGKRPAIYACDYARGWDTAHNPADLIDYGCNATLKNIYTNQGGLVQISNHLPSPIPWNGGGLNAAIQNWQYAAILQPGHNYRTRWLQILDKVAAGLADLQSAGVTVIYRPLHEMNGEWFWWGNTSYNANDVSRQQHYRDLYIDMFNYFTYHKGLNNLIWVFSPDAKRDHKTAFYPGDAYVDIVGLDAYTSSPYDSAIQSGYAELTALNKPYAFAEIGPDSSTQGNYDYQAFINAIHSHYPKTIYFIPWNNVWSPTQNQNSWYLFNDSWTVNLGEIP